MIDPITEYILKEIDDSTLKIAGIGGAAIAVGLYKGVRQRQRLCKEKTKTKEDYKKCMKRPKNYK